MIIHILAPGPLKYPFVKEGLEYFQKLLSKWIKIKVELPKVRGSFQSREARVLAEEELLENRIPDGSYTVLLDEKGANLNTREFCLFLERFFHTNRNIVFLIGGPEGVSSKLKRRADFTLTLSPLTLNHEIALLVLAEALFRAVSLLRGHPYHRD